MEESWSGSFSSSCWVRCPTHWRGDYPTEGSAEGGGTRAETGEYICGDGSLKKKKSVWFGEKNAAFAVNGNTVFLSSFNTFVRDKTEEFRGVDKSSIFNILNWRFPGALEGFWTWGQKIKRVEFFRIATGQWKCLNLFCAKRQIVVLNSWCCCVDPRLKLCRFEGIMPGKFLNLIFRFKTQGSLTASTTEHRSFLTY